MSIVFNPTKNLIGDSATESKVFRNCDRVQLDYGASPVVSVEVMGRVDQTANWVSTVGVVPKTADYELLIIPEMPYQKIVFVGGDGTEVAYAVNITGAYN